MTRYYSAIAVDNTLASAITSGSTTLVLNNSPVGYPSAGPFVLALDYNTSTEELVLVTGASGTTLTVTRGFNGTTAQSHAIGGIIRHVITAQDLTDAATHQAASSGVHGITGSVVGTTDTQTLTNKTIDGNYNTFLNVPVTSLPTNGVATALFETVNVVGSGANGAMNVDLATSGVWYYTSAATGNFTLNFRKNSSTTLASALAVGQSATVVFISTNGSTPYYATGFSIDGTSVTPVWGNGVSPTAGNASAVDAYQFTIVKTAATPTYSVFAAGPIKYA